MVDAHRFTPIKRQLRCIYGFCVFTPASSISASSITAFSILFSIALAILLSSSIAFAQTSQLVLRFPDGSNTGLGSTCFEDQECALNTPEITQICQQEGVYSLLFTSHLPDASTNKYPEHDAHTVNWNSQTYCTPACTGQNTAFSATAQFCCGAHRNRDCGFRFGNELCGDTSASTWEYANLQNNIGDIYQFMCANASVVSNGNTFFACGDSAAFVSPPSTIDQVPITRGQLTHDYVCAELHPDDATSLKTWIECHGNQNVLTRKSGQSADFGVGIQFGTLLNKKLSSSETLEINQAFNFNPVRGVIFATVKPSWRGTDGLSHTFFAYSVDDANFLKIIKQSDSTIACQYENNGGFHSPQSITASTWGIGELHTIKMSYDSTSGKVTCTVDGASTEAGGAGALPAGGKVILNSALLGAVPGQAEITVRTTDILNPNTLYCDTTGRVLSNLDTSGDRIATNERLTCESAGLKWTGTKCCSEDDDKPNEFYNDPDPRASAPATSSSTNSPSSIIPLTISTTIPPTGQGTAAEGIFFPTGGVIIDPSPFTSDLTPSATPSTSPRFKPLQPITGLGINGIDITGMQTVDFSALCPGITAPSCNDGTLIPQFSQTIPPACTTIICSPWKTTTPGTCWNSTYFRNGQFAPGTQDKVMAAQGRWLGCQISLSSPTSSPSSSSPASTASSSPNPADQGLLQLKDKHTAGSLITEADVCTLAVNLSGVPNNNRVCSFRTKSWIVPSGATQHRLNANPLNSTDKECCPKDSCWNGESCIANQRDDSEVITFHDFRCNNGTWINQTPIATPDGKDKGFCPENNQCLVNNRGNKAHMNQPLTFFSPQQSDQPTCIRQGQYILNRICEAKLQAKNIPPNQPHAEWKSRALLIGLQLVELGESASPNDYAIFCGSFDDVLNFVNYQPEISTSSVRSYLTTPCIINGLQAPCVNSFCAMRFAGNNIAFGTSTNIPIHDPSKSFLLALGKPANTCSAATKEDSTYQSCGTGGEGIYYNNLTASIIKIPSQMNMPGTNTSQLIENRFPSTILSRMTILTEFMNRPLLKNRKEFFNRSANYGELFITKTSGKNYFGIMERDQFSEQPLDYVALAYDGFPVVDPLTGKKPCDMIADKILPADLLETDCSFDNNNLRYAAFSRTPIGDVPSNLRTFWKDLTAKLR